MNNNFQITEDTIIVRSSHVHKIFATHDEYLSLHLICNDMNEQHRHVLNVGESFIMIMDIPINDRPLMMKVEVQWNIDHEIVLELEYIDDIFKTSYTTTKTVREFVSYLRSINPKLIKNANIEFSTECNIFHAGDIITIEHDTVGEKQSLMVLVNGAGIKKYSYLRRFIIRCGHGQLDVNVIDNTKLLDVRRLGYSKIMQLCDLLTFIRAYQYSNNSSENISSYNIYRIIDGSMSDNGTLLLSTRKYSWRIYSTESFILISDNKEYKFIRKIIDGVNKFIDITTYPYTSYTFDELMKFIKVIQAECE